MRIIIKMHVFCLQLEPLLWRRTSVRVQPTAHLAFPRLIKVGEYQTCLLAYVTLPSY
jgi:hypothetical protein